MIYRNSFTFLVGFLACSFVDGSNPNGRVGSSASYPYSQQQQSRDSQWYGQAGQYSNQQQSHEEELPIEVDDEDLPPLPPGWSEHYDPASGQMYYYNAADGTTTWDRPSGSETEDGTPLAPTSEVEGDTQSTESQDNMEDVGEQSVDQMAGEHSTPENDAYGSVPASDPEPSPQSKGQQHDVDHWGSQQDDGQSWNKPQISQEEPSRQASDPSVNGGLQDSNQQMQQGMPNQRNPYEGGASQQFTPRQQQQQQHEAPLPNYGQKPGPFGVQGSASKGPGWGMPRDGQPELYGNNAPNMRAPMNNQSPDQRSEQGSQNSMPTKPAMQASPHGQRTGFPVERENPQRPQATQQTHAPRYNPSRPNSQYAPENPYTQYPPYSQGYPNNYQQQPQQQQPYRGQGQLVPQGQANEGAVKEAFNTAWRGILGFGNRTREVVGQARESVATSAVTASQSISSTSAGLWDQAKNSIGAVFEGGEKTPGPSYSLSGQSPSLQSQYPSGYPPQQGGYNAQQRRYPVPERGHPPQQQQSYPPQQQGYRPQQGRPPSQGGPPQWRQGGQGGPMQERANDGQGVQPRRDPRQPMQENAQHRDPNMQRRPSPQEWQQREQGGPRPNRPQGMQPRRDPAVPMQEGRDYRDPSVQSQWYGQNSNPRSNQPGRAGFGPPQGREGQPMQQQQSGGNSRQDPWSHPSLSSDY